MLTLTETATTVVKSIISRQSDAADGGLRIKAKAESDREFGVEVVSAPAAGDHVVDTDGARVFLEENAAVVLGDKVLDATVSESGAVTFALLPQV